MTRTLEIEVTYEVTNTVSFEIEEWEVKRKALETDLNVDDDEEEILQYIAEELTDGMDLTEMCDGNVELDANCGVVDSCSFYGVEMRDWSIY